MTAKPQKSPSKRSAATMSQRNNRALPSSKTATSTPGNIAALDHRYVWHPFTQMRDWLREKPIVIQSGIGAVLTDTDGRAYLDANASIWTNLHGHRHPQLDAALRRQIALIAHSSALGLANVPASQLAAQLIQASQPLARKKSSRPKRPRQIHPAQGSALAKVFFSDDGSTALEVALKLAYEFTRRQRGRQSRPRFLSLAGAYHGDTVGAVSVGHIDLFHRAYAGLLFKTDRVMAPYCYRCPHNRARPERADARLGRRCQWECVGQMEQLLERQGKKRGEPYAGFVFEPRIQGAAGMIAHPADWLPRTTALAREHGALLIADEVMTGFGRTGGTALFATTDEGIVPDFLCLAKGLTAGYLPMAATLTTQPIFDAFLGEFEEFKTFFHGHSYTSNQLGAAVALASLGILKTSASTAARQQLQDLLQSEMDRLWTLPAVGDIRQAGLVAGIELVRHWPTRRAFAPEQRIGQRVCAAMARRGVLTRPVGDVVVLMPPYCCTATQIKRMVAALADAITEVLGEAPEPGS
jgi:adenosylmethionine---8-amino-7-oxononanoate aminotransferase